MNYKFLCCIMDKENRNFLKDYLIKIDYKYNLDFKIKKDKSETFNFWIFENHNRDKLQSEIKRVMLKEYQKELNKVVATDDNKQQEQTKRGIK